MGDKAILITMLTIKYRPIFWLYVLKTLLII